MGKFKISFTLFYFLIIIHVCTCKFLRQSIPRRKKSNSTNGKIEARIIGGRPTYPGEFPYQLQMLYNTNHVCGATLTIAPTTGKQIVITAGHCVNFEILPNCTIRAGSIFIDGNNTQSLPIKRAVVHPKYINYLRNDIAVLFLDGEFQLNKAIQPLELPSANEVVKKEITVTGWGLTVSNIHSLPKRLQVLVMPVMSNRKCEEHWKNQKGEGKDVSNFVLPSHLCAGKLEGFQASCEGDSGGPAMAKDKKGRKFLAGVVSFGPLNCTNKGIPAVFTRVSKFVRWIDAVSKKFEKEG